MVLAIVVMISYLTTNYIGKGGNKTAVESHANCGTYIFDSSVWTKRSSIEAKDSAVSIRRKLAADIVKCRLLAGKTRSQVTQILGRPDPDSSTKTDWGYPTGDSPEGIGPSETTFLEVKFSSVGRVRHVYQ